MHDTIVTLSGREESPPCRRFTLADAMILVAGVTLPLAIGPLRGNAVVMLLRESPPKLWEAVAAHGGSAWEHWTPFWSAARQPLIQTVWTVCKIVQGYLYALTFCVLILRLKRPRPPARELLRQPGMVALLAIVFGLIWVPGYLDAFFHYFKDHTQLTVFVAVGGTVAVAWVVLALSRRARQEPGWIDRAGRALGATAIALALAFFAIHQL